MLFNSYGFVFLFLPVSLAGFFALGRFGRKPAAAWLASASFAFYGWWNPAFLALLAISIGFNYAVGASIAAAEDAPRRQGVWLALGIAVNLGALFYYKYFFALLHFADTLGWRAGAGANVVLPLGISFFTFTQIGYLVDVKEGIAKDRGLLNYILFVTFFPHLIAGPILHNREIMPQFAEARTYRASGENLMVGLVIFSMGLAKKCLLADPIAAGISPGFAMAPHISLLAAWLTALTYALQLYFDFSGYSDMAIGIARMFNVRFPLNFNSPFKAASIIDYWQRWHMTLTRYLTLYLFNPIALAIARGRAARGRSIGRAGQASLGGFAAMVAFPLIVTMGLAGIWHGAGLQFLIFGLLHGVYLTVNHAWRTFRRKGRGAPKAAGPLAHVASVLLTMLCVIVALVFFRAPSAWAAVQMLGGMIGLHGMGALPLPGAALHALGPVGAMLLAHGVAASMPVLDFGKAAIHLGWIVLLYVVVWALPNTQQLMHRFAPALGRVEPGRPGWLALRPTGAWATAMGVAAAVSVLAIGGTAEFIYFQF